MKMTINKPTGACQRVNEEALTAIKEALTDAGVEFTTDENGHIIVENMDDRFFETMVEVFSNEPGWVVTE
jgi:hypothetical protein